MKTKLNKYEEALFRLLRFGLWNEPLAADSVEGCSEAVMSLARKQSVTGIVAKATLQDKEQASHIPNSLRLKLKSLVVSNVMTYEKMTENIRHFCYVVSNYFVHLREDIRIKMHHG